jgi:hypothetical protein
MAGRAWRVASVISMVTDSQDRADMRKPGELRR